MFTELKKTTVDSKGRIRIPITLQMGASELFMIFNADHIVISSEKPQESDFINTVGLSLDARDRVLIPQTERDRMSLSKGTKLMCKGIGKRIIIATNEVFEEIQAMSRKTLSETLSLAKTHSNP